MPFQTRVLKSDFARYNVDEEESEELDQEENGWKIIHTDVFRYPPYKNLFCAILGEFYWQVTENEGDRGVYLPIWCNYLMMVTYKVSFVGKCGTVT